MTSSANHISTPPAPTAYHPTAAGVTDLILADQKDDVYSDLFRAQCFETLETVAGARTAYKYRTLANYGAQILLDFLCLVSHGRTLGEEFGEVVMSKNFINNGESGTSALTSSVRLGSKLTLLGIKARLGLFCAKVLFLVGMSPKAIDEHDRRQSSLTLEVTEALQSGWAGVRHVLAHVISRVPLFKGSNQHEIIENWVGNVEQRASRAGLLGDGILQNSMKRVLGLFSQQPNRSFPPAMHQRIYQSRVQTAWKVLKYHKAFLVDFILSCNLAMFYFTATYRSLVQI